MATTVATNRSAKGKVARKTTIVKTSKAVTPEWKATKADVLNYINIGESINRLDKEKKALSAKIKDAWKAKLCEPSPNYEVTILEVEKSAVDWRAAFSEAVGSQLVSALEGSGKLGRTADSYKAHYTSVAGVELTVIAEAKGVKDWRSLLVSFIGEQEAMTRIAITPKKQEERIHIKVVK